MKTTKTLSQTKSKHQLALESTITPDKFKPGHGAESKGQGARDAGAGAAPINNMGVKSSDARQGDDMPGVFVSSDGSEDFYLVPTGKKGGAEKVAVPRPNSSVSSRSAFIDQLSFTVKTGEVAPRAFNDEDVVLALSADLAEILGFGVTDKRPAGLNFYQETYILGNDWGFVSIGGQRETVLVQVSGQGCMAARKGWEKRLYRWLSARSTSRLTRLDLAADFFTGAYTVDQAYLDYKAGAFNLGGRNPEIERLGNWDRPSGKGRTLYLGSRLSGKLLRVYEKGMQLGRGFVDTFASWVRVELELHNKQRVIPLDSLINPGHYLSGSYPALSFINQVQKKIETLKKSVKVTVESGAAILKRQFGRWLWALAEIADHDYEKVFRDLVIEKLPARLDFGDYRTSTDPMVGKAISFEMASNLTLA